MSEASHSGVTLTRDGDVLVAELSGEWSVHAGIPAADPIDRELRMSGDIAVAVRRQHGMRP